MSRVPARTSIPALLVLEQHFHAFDCRALVWSSVTPKRDPITATRIQPAANRPRVRTTWLRTDLDRRRAVHPESEQVDHPHHSRIVGNHVAHSHRNVPGWGGVRYRDGDDRDG